MNVGEAEIPALVSVGELLMVNPKQVKEGGLQVVNVKPVCCDVVAVFIAFTVGETGLGSTSGHPHGKATGVMIPPETVLVEFALAVVRSPELSAPDHEGVLEQAPLLKVGDEGGGCLVGFLALPLDSAGQTAVLVPSRMVKLDEAHVPFGQSPGKQAVGGIGARFARIVSIELESGFRFLAQVGHFRDGRLHMEAHLVLGNASFQGRVAGAFELDLMKFLQSVEHFSAASGGHALRTIEVEDGVLVGAKPNACMLAREKSVSPEARDERLSAFILSHEGYEVGQVRVHRAQTVGKPCPDAWSPRER